MGVGLGVTDQSLSGLPSIKARTRHPFQTLQERVQPKSIWGAAMATALRVARMTVVNCMLMVVVGLVWKGGLKMC